MPVAISGSQRAAAVHRLDHAVDAFVRELEERPPGPLTGGDWGPREILCHLVYWHEWYVAITSELAAGRRPPLKAGDFRALNAEAVRRLAAVPVPTLLRRLGAAERVLSRRLPALQSRSRIRIKAGAKARSPVEFADRIGGHFEAHLRQVRRMRRAALG